MEVLFLVLVNITIVTLLTVYLMPIYAPKPLPETIRLTVEMGENGEPISVSDQNGRKVFGVIRLVYRAEVDEADRISITCFAFSQNGNYKVGGRELV